MESLKKYKVLIIVAAVLALGISIFFVANKSNIGGFNSQYKVKDLPLKVESTPLNLNIVKENNANVLEATYTNDSEEVISRLVLEVLLKDTGEVIEMKCNQPVGAGETSVKFTGKAPASGKIDDVEVLKYKISLRNGTYMEYDVKLKQYNWS